MKLFPDRWYSSMLLSFATARVDLSDEKEWSAMGLWKRWWTSGAAMVEAIGVALYYRVHFFGVVWELEGRIGRAAKMTA
jgi:hypothetical protein